MFEKIKNALKENAIEVYTVKEITTESAELFFIRHDLDMRRMKNVTSYSVTVFRDFEANGKKMRGSSDAVIAPGSTGEEIRSDLAKAYDAAKNAGNPFFELYQGKTEEPLPDKSTLAKYDVAEIATLFAGAAFQADVDEDAFLNSLEVFAERTTVRFLSSAGFSIGYQKSVVKGEFITQCKKGQDVEQYFEFEYDERTPEALTEKVHEALQVVKDRAKAKENPASGTYDVVLSGENLRELLWYYFAQTATAMVFPHYSGAEVGKSIQGENITGEALNLCAVPALPYSREGVPMKERQLLKDGVVEFLHGDTQFAYYMGIEPTGLYQGGRLENGTVAFDELKKGCLYPVSFSDFRVDPISGEFGGEMRLAYYFDGDEVKILTGGSVNGRIPEIQAGMVFSLERYRDARYEGPFAVKIANVAVAGA